MPEVLVSQFISRKQRLGETKAAVPMHAGNGLCRACAALSPRVGGLFFMLESHLRFENSLTQHMPFARAFGFRLQLLALKA